MYKIEIHTTCDELADLDFLNEIGAQIIGGVQARHFRKHLPDSAASAKIPALNRAGMKVEVFTASLDDYLLQRLTATGAVLDVRVHRCEAVDFNDSTDENVDPPVTPHLSTTRCMVEPFTAGYLRLRVETGKNSDCLTVIFRSLAASGIEVQNGDGVGASRPFLQFQL